MKQGHTAKQAPTAWTHSLVVLGTLLGQDEGPLPVPGWRLDEIARAYVEERHVPGCTVGVVRGDELVFAEAYGVLDLASQRPVEVDSLFPIGSLTKTFTASLLLALRDDGVLRLDDPVARFLPEDVGVPREAGARAITLEDLVTHTSGLPGNPPNRRNLPDSPAVMLPYDVSDLYAGLRTTALTAPPGARFEYSNYGFGLLGHALERAGRQPYEALLRERLLLPLGMTRTRVHLSMEEEGRVATAYWPEPWPLEARERWRFGEVCAFGGLVSNVPELSRWAMLFLGTHPALRAGRAPLSSAALRELTTPRRLLAPDWSIAIGLGWWIHRRPAGERVSHGGEVDGHSCDFHLSLRNGLGVLVLASRGADTAGVLAERLFDELVTAAERERRALLAAEAGGEERLAGLRRHAGFAPLDGEALFALGSASAAARVHAQAEEAFLAAAGLGFQRAVALYNAACSATLGGGPERAFPLLERARACGFFDRDQWLADPDLTSLHQDPRWARLLAED